MRSGLEIMLCFSTVITHAELMITKMRIFNCISGKFRHSVVQGWVEELKTIRNNSNSATGDLLREVGTQNSDTIVDEPRASDQSKKSTEATVTD